MKIFCFHLMPYTAMPTDYEGSAWVTCPNSLYDPLIGNQLYNAYLDDLIRAESLGFDGVVVNEHHSTPYGMMPSPNLIASILARQTSRIRIAVLGNALPLYNPPTRVAEEWAMIDVISGGRLIAGMVLGGGAEYFSSSQNPVFARERFREAHNLIIECWTQPGPFEFNGVHYKLRHVNPWPQPLQRPHPPIWIPGTGSAETLEFIARHKYAFMGIPYFHRKVTHKNLTLFKEMCERHGYVAAPSQLGWLAPIYVAESDQQAREQFEPHFWHFVRTLLPGINIQPPGYITPRSMPNMIRAMASFLTNVREWDEVIDGSFAIVGSPQTVRERLLAELIPAGVGNLLAMFRIGTLPDKLCRNSVDLFAREVMPALKQSVED